MKTETQGNISLKSNTIYDKSTSHESDDEENTHFFGQKRDNTHSFTTPYFYKYEEDSLSSNGFENVKNEKHNKIKDNPDSQLLKSLLGDKFNDDSISIEKNQVNISLNQIKVGNDEIKLNHFPIIEEINFDDYNIPFPEKILERGEFVTAIVDKIEPNKNNLIPKNFEINTKTFFNELSNKDNSYGNILKEIYDDLECEKKNKIALRKIVKSIYEKCKCILFDIKRNVKNRKKKSVNANLSCKLYVLMKIHNDIYREYLSQNNLNDIVTDEKENQNYNTYKKLFLEKIGGKIFECEICNQKFSTYQSLGGHMSKLHPEQSTKYREKMIVRKNRENQRKLLETVRKKLFEKYNMDYYLIKNRNEKTKIKSFIKEHYKEYNYIKRKIYRGAKLASFYDTNDSN